jgi:hypothetical protein
MDPKETLRQLRELCRDWQQYGCADNALNFGNEIAEKFEALDDWMKKGGFSPWSAS